HLAEGGERLADARVVGHPPLGVERDVEVDPHEHPLAAECQIVDGAEHGPSRFGRRDAAQRREMSILVRSTIRLLKPHSLSYQAISFTRLPSMTKVLVPSTLAECGLPLKSTDTVSSVLNSRMFFNGPSAARR